MAPTSAITAAGGETSTSRARPDHDATAAATTSAMPSRSAGDAHARASSRTCRASMIAPAMGIAAKTYWSEMPIEGERWVAIAGTSAAPCQTRMAGEQPDDRAVTAWRTTSRTPRGKPGHEAVDAEVRGPAHRHASAEERRPDEEVAAELLAPGGVSFST